ncbi:MAG: FAD-binding oxidoreductase [Blastocatellia bacterium]|nr:FAD-binding oxidoreductase [Blastocatellia bacterium]
MTKDLYFRPDARRLLLSPCDETPHPAVRPGCDPAASELLAEKVSHSFPHLADLAIHNAWACLRTMPPDHRFVIGWDAAVQGFLHVAGLGGHGVTVSPAVGQLAAQLILQQIGQTADAEFAPVRFHSSRHTIFPAD